MSKGFGSITPDRGGYRVRIYIHGQRLTRRADTEEQADLILQTLQKRKILEEEGGTPVGTATDATLADAIPIALKRVESAEDRTYSKRTIATYKAEFKVLEKRFGSRRLASITTADARAWKRELRAKNASASTVRHLLDRLSQAVRVGIREGWVVRPPLDVERPRLAPATAPRRASEHEYARLLEAARGDYDRRAEWAVLLMGDAGLRVSEAAGLKVSDVRLEERVLRLRVTKGGAWRPVPILSDKLRKALELAIAGRPGNELVLGVRSKDGVYGILARPWKKVWSKDETPHAHALRRRFARWQAVERGTPVPVVQAWLGHGDVRTTMTYVGLDPSHVPAAAFEEAGAATGPISKRGTGPKTRKKAVKRAKSK